MAQSISEEEIALLKVLKKMKLDDPEQLEDVLTKKSMKQEEKYQEKDSLKFPRISLFYGEPGKGEVSYRAWRYEVNCLIKDKTYSHASMLLGIRRSLRGEAADMVMRLGEEAKVEEILELFQSSFGNIESPESTLKKFHACEQGENEPVVKYASRVEEMFSRAVELGALARTQQILLKSVFYEGLNVELKIASAFKYETTSDYNMFKAEIRKLEQEFQSRKSTGKSKQCQATTLKPENSELGEIKSLLEKMNARIEVLEKEKGQTNVMQQYPQNRRGNPGETEANPKTRGSDRGYHVRGQRGPRHFTGMRDQFQGRRPFRGQGRGTESYRPKRPFGSNMFKPHIQCYSCNEYGHFASECPLNE